MKLQKCAFILELGWSQTGSISSPKNIACTELIADNFLDLHRMRDRKIFMLFSVTTA